MISDSWIKQAKNAGMYFVAVNLASQEPDAFTLGLSESLSANTGDFLFGIFSKFARLKILLISN